MDGDLFSREEVLGGLPARRAGTLLFLIESRTAHLVARSRQALEISVTGRTVEERDQAFLEAFRLGREPPLRPTIRELERYAAEWADLIPDNPRLRAALAHAFGEKYRFRQSSTPGIRAALGLDTAEVRQAYERTFGGAVDSIFAPRLTPSEELRWKADALTRRLESLPPFWTAFALTLTETVGAGLLAIPIAVANLGPLAGVALLVIFGLINLVTIAAMAEAVSRSGVLRFAGAFLGRMVSDYLGTTAALILTVSLSLTCFLVLIAYYVGIASTLSHAVGVPKFVLPVLLVLAAVYFLTRKTLTATVSSALLTGTVNITLVLIIALLSLAHLHRGYLTYARLPLLDGSPFDPRLIQLVFGVILAAYFGHLSLSNCARVVLRRDSGARSLMRGVLAAQIVAMLLYSLWVVAVNGAVDHATLARESGTALVPLSSVAGPAVAVLGAVLVVLSMGMASIHFSYALFNVVRERLPVVGDIPRSARRPNLHSPVDVASGPAGSPGILRTRLSAVVLNRNFGVFLSVAPVLLVFAIAEWLIITGSGSFAAVFNVFGVVAASVFAGIFPMLLLTSSRHKGEFVPRVVYTTLGSGFVVIPVYALYLVGLWLYGLVIWHDILLRACALFVALLMMAATEHMRRQGAFRWRMSVELRMVPAGQDEPTLKVAVSGQPIAARVAVAGHQSEPPAVADGVFLLPRSLESCTVELPASRARELRVWVHKALHDGDFERIPAGVLLEDAGASAVGEPSGSYGELLLPLSGNACRLTITLEEAVGDNREKRSTTRSTTAPSLETLESTS